MEKEMITFHISGYCGESYFEMEEEWEMPGWVKCISIIFGFIIALYFESLL
jgi:hypothetical protein